MALTQPGGPTCVISAAFRAAASNCRAYGRAMAIIYQATLNPSKRNLLNAWLPSRPWFTGVADAQRVGAYRFDESAGEVGIEAFLLQAGDGSVLHAPLTYRGAPLAGAEEFLIGTTEHSVLGGRWVYDGCGDPVWAAALAKTVLTGGTQVEEFVDVDGRVQPREATATVLGKRNGRHAGR
jgi:hypothetical protein